MKLHQAFDVVRGDVVAFVGAGGKTSTMLALGHELAESGWRVLATTTTQLSEEQLASFPHGMRLAAGSRAISDALTDHRFVFLYDHIEKGAAYGPAMDRMQLLLDTVDSDVLLVEADNAHGLPFKAPAANEPVIPPETSLVVPLVGLSALDKPLDEDHVGNPQAMIDRFGFYKGGKVRSPWIAQVLRDETLGLKDVPDRARAIAFLNQAPQEGYLRTRARLIAKLALKSPKLYGVAIGSARSADPVVEVQRPVAAIILAGGQSSRMGQPKVLLPWDSGQTIIEHIITQLIRSRVEHIVVVTGHYAEEVKRIVKPMDVRVVHNRAYRTGEMVSSLKAGLRSLPDHIAAAMFVLGDQPRIQPRVIYDVLKAYAEGVGDIVIPSYQMRRGHPILVGRRYWSEFLALRNNATPRDVINAHEDRITYVKVYTDSVIRDVDTPSDYYEERLRAGLRQNRLD
ncbi:putative selenium-dependent hydroxylase accessory protein YqeC [Phototrophicus methaneseepsis]|uniref:Putative selenium-dependent hydroxylase accessory protein YqeC n=1 Tax=Phototrophicus methaneseepsis TaxID=2710758 RepID=A0A7S8E6Y9_9CHLR|nr:selenium cofactor biosynthesis protein YqeC [Phototrophicus methaneseepsis]QPC81484.1 putative selenium-dependent hydroxylase accessory protein YqeC [Phototrophicus methaneseepsis]